MLGNVIGSVINEPGFFLAGLASAFLNWVIPVDRSGGIWPWPILWWVLSYLLTLRLSAEREKAKDPQEPSVDTVWDTHIARH